MFKDNPFLLKPTDFQRFFVGFDPLIERLASAAEQTTKLAQNYPPYNIKKIGENKYSIEIAVAGFGKQDLEIDMVDDKLIIKGNIQNEDVYDFLYQGLASRPFTRTFNLADNVEIRGASLLNGILKVALEAIIPEHKKPKKVVIDDEEYPSQAAEFLAEGKTK